MVYNWFLRIRSTFILFSSFFHRLRRSVLLLLLFSVQSYSSFVYFFILQPVHLSVVQTKPKRKRRGNRYVCDAMRLRWIFVFFFFLSPFLFFCTTRRLKNGFFSFFTPANEGLRTSQTENDQFAETLPSASIESLFRKYEKSIARRSILLYRHICSYSRSSLGRWKLDLERLQLKSI